MPVTTDTLHNIRKLNWVFAATSVVTLGTMLWMMKNDFERPWRTMQNEFMDAKSAMARFTAMRYDSPEEQAKFKALDAAVKAAEAKLKQPEMARREKELTNRLTEVEGKLQGAALTFGNLNAEIQVTAFMVEEHRTLHGANDSRTRHAREKYEHDLKTLAEAQKLKEALSDEKTELKAQLKALYRERDDAKKALAAYQKGRDDAKRNRDMYGRGFTRTVFNLPGIDFLAPTGTPGRQEVKQVFMQNIRINYNFLESYVTDRCITCHVGIDNPDMTRENFIKQAEGALQTDEVAAVLKGQNERLRSGLVQDLDDAVAGSDYSKIAVDQMDETQKERLLTLLVTTTNEFLAYHKRPKLPAAQMDAILALARTTPLSRADMYNAITTRVERILAAARPRTHDDKRVLADSEMSDEQQKAYGDALASALNTYLAEEGQPQIKFTQPFLAHPRLDLFVGPDSPHPVKEMGCTVCHEGSGQETDFVFAAHTPKTHAEKEEWERKYYVKELGVPQTTFHLVEEFWERPMLRPEHTSASCVKCHDQVMDLEKYKTLPLEEAHNVVEGRKLFAQVGCINCHNVDGLSDLRRVGPDLQHVGGKLSTGFMEKWIWYPNDFRPSTRMPHFFRQENTLSRSANDDDPNPALRTQVEVQAITHYLNKFSKPFDARPLPEGLTGDVARGEALFTSVGCLACHANLDAKDPTDEAGRTFGERWITTDLVMARGMAEDAAKSQYGAMKKNDRIRYAKENFTPERRDEAFKRKLAEEIAADAEGGRDPDPKKTYLPPSFTRFAPELSSMGTKLVPTAGDADQTANATSWLYNWLKDPRHYAPETKMPRLFEDNYYWKHPPAERQVKSDQDILDLTAYLLSQRHDTFDSAPIPRTPEGVEEMKRLIRLLLGGQNTVAVSEKILNDEKSDPSDAAGRLSKSIIALAAKSFGEGDAGKQRVTDMLARESLESRQELFLGMKMIGHYGCNACHSIPGFEDATRPGTDLSTWGQKFITQLDFAFYSPPFEHEVEENRDVFGWLYPKSDEAAHLVRDSGGVNIPQEILHNHAAFAYHKLRNPRIWDREKIKKPYDKLKMPNFFFTDAEAESLVTFLLSRKDKNVRPAVQVDYSDTPTGKIAKGRHLAHELNCIACHTIEGNHANIQQYYVNDPSKPDSDPTTIRFQPPLLWGEGSKVQPQWLHKFLKRVEYLRPWLNVRMPTFYVSTEEAAGLVEYFVGVAQDESQMLTAQRAELIQYIKDAHKGLPATDGDGKAVTAGEDWFLNEKFADKAGFLAKYAIAHEQIKPTQLNRGEASTPKDVVDAIGSVFMKIIDRTGFLSAVFNVHYPYPDRTAPPLSDERFKLAEEFFFERKCLACHVAGDPSAPGTTTDIKAPNFALTHERLRYDWVREWMVDPQALMPGTNMPQVFPNHQSGLTGYSPEERAELEKKFGATGDEQISLLVDFLYELGRRRYTAVQPGGTGAPDGAASEPAVDFDFDGGGAATTQPAGEGEKKEEPAADFDF